MEKWENGKNAKNIFQNNVRNNTVKKITSKLLRKTRLTCIAKHLRVSIVGFLELAGNPIVLHPEQPAHRYITQPRRVTCRQAISRAVSMQRSPIVARRLPACSVVREHLRTRWPRSLLARIQWGTWVSSARIRSSPSHTEGKYALVFQTTNIFTNKSKPTCLPSSSLT